VKCLETRRKNGMKWRRYRTSDNRIVTTYELPTQVLGLSKELQRRLAMWESNQVRQGLVEQAKKLIARGWKNTAIAHHLGRSDSWVKKIKQKMKKEKQDAADMALRRKSSEGLPS